MGYSPCMRTSRPARKYLNTLFNMGFRVGGLVLKFVLTLYLARYFSMSDVGVYGLVLGAAAAMPSVFGWGLNYFLSRDIVDATPLEAGLMMRNRIILSLSSYLPVLAIFLALSSSGVISFVTMPWLVAGVLLFESLAQDLHLALVGQRKAFLANLLFFLRSALWVPPFIAMGLLNPAYRTLDLMFLLWMSAAMLHIPIMLLALRNWPWKQIIVTPLGWSLKSFAARLKHLKIIYLSDISQTGTMYLDRYIILHLLGLELVGVYTLFWSFGNAMYAVIQAGLIQTSLPQLVSLFKQKNLKGYWHYWVRYLAKVLAACALFSVALMAALPFILLWSNKQALVAYWPLMGLILLGISLRSGSDVIRHNLYSRHLDNLLPWLNLTGLAVSTIFNFIFMHFYGLWGSGMALTATGLALAIMAGWFTFRLFRTDGMTLADLKTTKIQN